MKKQIRCRNLRSIQRQSSHASLDVNWKDFPKKIQFGLKWYDIFRRNYIKNILQAEGKKEMGKA